MFRSFVWATAVIFGPLILSSAQATELVFSNFGKHGTSNPGYCITGPATSDCGPTVWRGIAASFVPAAGGSLDSLHVAVGYQSGTQGVVVTLVADRNGAPSLVDPILESWTLSGKEKPCCDARLKDTLTSMLHPTLSRHSTYWLVVAPLGFDSLSGWQVSPTSSAGYDTSFDGGATWGPQAGSTPAFDIWVQ
jgi:hypothetical protein